MYCTRTDGRTCPRYGCYSDGRTDFGTGRRKTLGRLFNVLGEPIDEIAPPQTKEHWPIHRKAPSFEEQATSQEMLETGIKVVDLLCPYQKGGKIGLFGGAGVGKPC